MFGYGTQNAGTVVNGNTGRNGKNGRKFDYNGDVEMAVLGGVCGKGGNRGRANVMHETRTCFNCGKVGHLSADCCAAKPQNSRGCGNSRGRNSGRFSGGRFLQGRSYMNNV